jgi:hypothetical protein
MDVLGLMIFGGLILLTIAAGMSILYDHYKKKERPAKMNSKPL